jgi:hypothetical protein
MTHWLTVEDLRRVKAETLLDEMPLGRQIDRAITRSLAAWAAHRRKRLSDTRRVWLVAAEIKAATSR